MTIIRPNKNNKKLYNFLMLGFGLLVVVFIISGIAIYGSVVGLKHDIEVMQKNIQDEELVRAKIQNDMYSITDVSFLEKKAIEIGLVKESNPEYLNVDVMVKPEILGQVSASL